jgi:molecular chaperone GrpE
MTKKQENTQPAKKTDKKELKSRDLEQQVGELTLDLQRVRADFENYRKRTETDIANAKKTGADTMLLKLLPVIDVLERALRHTPDELADNAWVKGVSGITKKLDAVMRELEIERIEAKENEEFNPDLHHAIQIDEDSDGEKEVIAEELQAGYVRSGRVVRHSMVKVTRK